ncbi:Conserved hypothetical protein [gamma proteobacterium HdN1]|nr:Conserved hypothetical protein [gamma proteobacterium HdN1]
MKNIFKIASAAALALSAATASALEIGGIQLPDQYPVMGQSLVLNGAGVREKFFFELYVGGLYLPAQSKDAAAIVAADENQSIRLSIISNKITSDRMVSSTMEGFEKSLNGKLGELEPRIKDFVASFHDEIKDGDYFDLVYQKGDGVHVYKNGKKVKVVKGLDFKKALFGIWLSDNPAQASLKAGMLGGK